MCLATMAYVYVACAGHVTIFSTGGKSRPISHFTELQALTRCLFLCALDTGNGLGSDLARLLPRGEDLLH